MQNKRGQGLSTSAIVLIILGVAILVFLILGFTMGWSRILPWLGGNNVDSIVQQCGAACASASKYGFCSQERELRAENNVKLSKTCKEFATNTAYAPYGIADCDITCDTVASCTAKDAADAETCGALTSQTTCDANDLCSWQ